MKEDKQLSENFSLSEFGWIMPDVNLLYILQKLRTLTGRTIKIINGARTPEQHISIYKKLEKENKIYTKGNGFGVTDLIDLIPWGSRHLSTFKNNNLRAVDITCKKGVWKLYEGSEIKDMIGEVLSDFNVNIPVGIGVADYSLHLDTDRKTDATWRYDY